MAAHRYLLPLALLCIAGTAAAEPAERRFYAGLDVGQAQLNRDRPDFIDPRSDGESPGWKLRFGIQFSPYWSVEAGYTDFGHYDGSLTIFAVPGASPIPAVIGGAALAPGDLRTKARGIDLSTVFHWPVGESFYVQAAAGLQRREMKTEVESVIIDAPDFRASDGDLALLLGAGLGFHVNDVMDIGVHWASTRNLEGDFEYFENDADPSLVSLGMRFRF
jgi:opacity protein-like surface antigen